MTARKEASKADRTWICSAVDTRTLVENGDQRRERIGPEASVVGSRTALTACKDSVERTWMEVEVRVAMNCPLGLSARCDEAGWLIVSAMHHSTVLLRLPQQSSHATDEA